jgi:hypothetical protein
MIDRRRRVGRSMSFDGLPAANGGLVTGVRHANRGPDEGMGQQWL